MYPEKLRSVWQLRKRWLHYPDPCISGNLLICKEKYVGETGRSVYDRLTEHLRYASNPTSRSYTEEAFAIHYRENHAKKTPQLRFEILDSDINIIRRKILEPYYIYSIKPTINKKAECTQIKRFLV